MFFRAHKLTLNWWGTNYQPKQHVTPQTLDLDLFIRPFAQSAGAVEYTYCTSAEG